MAACALVRVHAAASPLRAAAPASDEPTQSSSSSRVHAGPRSRRGRPGGGVVGRGGKSSHGIARGSGSSGYDSSPSKE